MNPIQKYIQAETRRQFFKKGAMGLGTAALSTLLAQSASATGGNDQLIGAPGLPHHAPKAKRAIYLFMSGRSIANGYVRLQT